MKFKGKISTYIQYFCIALILCIALVTSVIRPDEICYADNVQDSQEILEDNIDQNLSGLDLESLQRIFESLDGDFKSLFGEDVVTTVKGIIQRLGEIFLLLWKFCSKVLANACWMCYQ